MTFEEKRQTHPHCDFDFNDLIITIHDNNDGVANSKINTKGICKR
jgi:hypothetical protein